MKRRLSRFAVALLLVVGCQRGEPRAAEAQAPSSPPADYATARGPQATQDLAQSRENAIVRAIERAGPAVVNISSTQVVRVVRDPFWSFFWGESQVQEQKRQSLGSGVIFDAEHGYVLTNEHVIEDATYVTVRLQDGREFRAEILGEDPIADLAVLKIDGEDLPACLFGTSDDLRIGEWAIAIGNPFGQLVRDLKPSVTVGVISATNRVVQVGNRTYSNLIQTDAAVNPGNSGGPLVNAAGEVIGINTFILSESGGSHGVNFAHAISLAKRVIDRILENGGVEEPWVGMQYREVTPQIAEQIGASVREGVIVTRVERGGPADKAGLRENDIITQVNGQKVYSTVDTYSIIRLVRSGERIELTRVRGDVSGTVRMTAEVLPGYEFYGTVVRDTSEVRGVVVRSVQSGSVFARVLRPGDRIIGVGNRRVDTVEELRGIARQIRSGYDVTITFERRNQQHQYTFRASD
ncbi:PDZ domain-containing protein [Candidatus Poribacteria bacterium]|nr:PDZ domain-containing protein [Candidatus Poribacteria bacterium]